LFNQSQRLHITPLIIDSLRGRYTCTHAYKHHGQKQFQETSRAPAFGRHAPDLKKYCIMYLILLCSNEVIYMLFHCVINSVIFLTYSPWTTGSQPSWCTGFNKNDCKVQVYTENLFYSHDTSFFNVLLQILYINSININILSFHLIS